ncbi:hypothetical protein [Sorangium sp. So ce388]|uniref:hypothetical protein n=1 Tax=Sorangium sp. So ce388 TaxID=3133309 RepID=UPI003F5B8DE5
MLALQSQPEAMADGMVALLAAAKDELRLLVRDAIAKGPRWALLITEADAVDVEDAAPEFVAKRARLQPGDPWVELLPIDEIINICGTADGADMPAAHANQLRRLAAARTPRGQVKVVMALGNCVHAFCAEIEPMTSAGRGALS